MKMWKILLVHLKSDVLGALIYENSNVATLSTRRSAAEHGDVLQQRTLTLHPVLHD